jgi:hypothetical protein
MVPISDGARPPFGQRRGLADAVSHKKGVIHKAFDAARKDFYCYHHEHLASYIDLP